MKCDENGGCPMENESLAYPEREVLSVTKSYHATGEPMCLIQLNDKTDCHLTPTDFPRIRAEIAGEWKCSNCQRNGDDCLVIEDVPCKDWQLKESH